MALGTMIAAIALLQASAGNAQTVEVAFEELKAQENTAAIEKIEVSKALEEGDPASLINLGIAHAREGRVTEARTFFNAAATTATRYRLETATGEWVDSRWLAKKALALLDEGLLDNRQRLAAR